MSQIWKSLFGWGGGIKNYRVNPLNAPGNSLVDGQNLDLSNGTLKTRPGCSVTSTGSLPIGEVRSLKNVRFPSNETSYLVCQMVKSEFSITPPGNPAWIDDTPDDGLFGSLSALARMEHTAIWCPDIQKIIIFGGFVWVGDTGIAPTDELWTYDPVAKVAELIAQTGDAPTPRGSHVACWDSDNSRMLIHGGSPWFGLSGFFQNCLDEVWAYDPATNTWTEITTTGGGVIDINRAGHAGVLIGDKWYMTGGESRIEWKGFHQAHVLDIATYEWSLVNFSGEVAPEGALYNGSYGMFHCLTDYEGSIFHVGGTIDEVGCNLECSLDPAEETYTWGPLIPLDAGLWGHAIVEYDGYVISTGGSEFLVDTYLTVFISSPNNGLLKDVAAAGTFRPRVHHTATRCDVTIDDIEHHLMVMIGGQSPDGTACYDDVLSIDLDDVVWEVSGGEVGGGGNGGGVEEFTPSIWCSDDHLPTTSAAFSSIYDFDTDPGVLTYAVLNDRVVMTEGISDPPLDWGGCQTNTGADWMYPKAVLVTQDGDNFYDISAQVCDKDVQNSAPIGGILPKGFIAICCDMPLVDGFFVEMDVANSVSGIGGATSYTDSMPVGAAADISQLDLKNTITSWVQDGGATGHFTNGITAQSIGVGNTCPDVVPGTLVDFSGQQLQIISVTGDGTGMGGVTLSATRTSAAVVDIVGLYPNGTLTTIPTGHASSSTIWSVAASSTIRLGGYSIRQIIKGSDLSASGDTIRITITVGSGFSYADSSLWIRRVGNSQVYGGPTYPLEISHVSIVERDGTSANGTTTPTEITFPQSFKLTSIQDQYGRWVYQISSSTAGAELVSDIINYPIDQAKEYLITMDLNGTWYQPPDASVFDPVLNRYVIQTPAAQRGGLLNVSSGQGYYLSSYSTVNNKIPQFWNQKTVTDIDSLVAGKCIGITKIETQIPYTISTNLYVATTTNTSQLDLTVIEDFQGVTVAQSIPGSCEIYHAISLDGRATFQIWDTGTVSWKTIVKQVGGAWKYLSADTPTWTSAPSNNLLTALRSAFGVATNQMDKTDLEAITSTQWKDIGGIVLHLTPTLDFAVGMSSDGDVVPTLTSYSVGYNDAGSTTVQGFKDGYWTAGDGWTDGTVLSYVPLGQDGIISYDGTDPFEAQYSTLNEVPGYWYRLQNSGTSATASITRIRYHAPCQPLANIGDGQPDTVLGCILHDVSADKKYDYSVAVSDFTTTELSSGLLNMATADFLYIGYYYPFGEVELTFWVENSISSLLKGEYWNGKSWVSLALTDGTAGATGKTFNTKGKISWSTPTDWRSRTPFTDLAFPRGYWVRFSVSVGLTSTTALSEVRIYFTPPTLAKHKIAETFRDRVALISRPDAPDQVDISRSMEEYGWIGSDSGSYRVGGMDSIQAAAAAWDSLLVGKTETWHQINGSTPSDFSFQGVEASRAVPVNTQSIIKAPMSGADDGTRQALYFLNRNGAFCSAGLQVDNTWNSSRGIAVSDIVNWWRDDAVPRLDLTNLHLACGEYYPTKNWLVWSVPMIVADNQTSQTTNNRLIVYDLTWGAWLPPFTISCSSLALAYHYCADAGGHIGPAGLYGGDYQGRVMRLFDPDADDDLGAGISCFATTPWMHFDAPQVEKEIREIMIHGEGSATVSIAVYGDGNATALETWTLESDDLTPASGMVSFQAHNVCGRFLKFKISWTGNYTIYGIQVSVSGIREEPKA